MRLLDYILGHDKSTMYKVGAVDGSSIFFIGTGAEFLEKVDKLNADLKKNADAIARSGRNIFRKYCEEAPSISKYMTDALTSADAKKREFKVSFDDYLDYCKKYLDRADDRYKALIRKEKYAKDFPMLHKREVVDEYPSTYEPGTTILIVNGNEAGRYWTEDEVKNGRIYNSVA